MIVAELRKAISKDITEGKKPFYVCATAGDTVFGAFDDFESISQVAKEYKVLICFTS